MTNTEVMQSFASEDALPDQPPAFKFTLQLTFSMLSHALRRPTPKSSPYSRSNLNPYLTVLLTFFSTVLKRRPTFDVLERSIPWEELGEIFRDHSQEDYDQPGLDEGAGQVQRPPKHRKMGHAH